MHDFLLVGGEVTRNLNWNLLVLTSLGSQQVVTFLHLDGGLSP